MATQWYYQAGGEERGPVGFRELMELVQAGGLLESDLVRSSWKTQWQPANSVVGLFYMAGRSPEELTRLAAASGPAPGPVAVDTSDEIATSESGETAEDRAAWMERLDEISVLRDPRSTDVRESPVTKPSIAGDGPTDGPPSVDEECPTIVVSSPRAPKMAIVTAVPNARTASAWSSAVDSALVSVDPRQAVAGQVTSPARVTGLVGRIAERIPSREVLDARLRIGFRAACAIVCAGIVAYAVESWSRREALRFPDPEVALGKKSAVRHFPLVGKCRSGEYLFLICDLMVVSGAAAWFGAACLESRAD